jgi:hypothetical protein
VLRSPALLPSVSIVSRTEKVNLERLRDKSKYCTDTYVLFSMNAAADRERDRIAAAAAGNLQGEGPPDAPPVVLPAAAPAAAPVIILSDLRLDVVLPERHDGALHDPQLRLQRDPEDSQSLEREGIWMVATRRPLGSRVQSPPPPYNSGEEHHDLQPRTSRESSSSDDDWICLFEDRLRSPSPTGRSHLRPRRDQNARRGRRG